MIKNNINKFNEFLKTQLIKFLFVGILNTIVGYSVFFLLILLNIYYVAALVISHIVSVSHSFIWNRKWTFKSENDIKKEGLLFFLVYGIVFFVNLFILTFFVENLMFDPRIGQIFALGVITIISFFGHKYISFRV